MHLKKMQMLVECRFELSWGELNLPERAETGLVQV